MRIGVLGGGPAGLYFAVLAKKADPSREVALVERNPPDATFGWGVVFSEETLGALRDADHESYEAITESFATWNAIDVHYRGEVVRSRGHAFSGVARKILLQNLQRRCREVGVEMSFHDELPDLSRFDDSDLIVAADGVNSTVRRLEADALGPSLDVHRSKYVWFGTDLVFDAFTFIFRETEHGVFQVHAYPFDGETSTFIVECNQATWERAGLDRATEAETMAFCRDLFAPELRGHKLMSNRSLWTSFVTVRCESWHRGKIVLLGDAAHTAHFTIGSGTKLAMEDAVSLAAALDRRPGSLEAAFTEYEMERQPVVERFQEAARESATYFENVSRYTHLEPLQFAFHLLTRSGRITHLELERRDPTFLAAVDSAFGWFAEGRRGATAYADFEITRRLLPPPPALVPLKLGATTVPNRVTLATPVCDCWEDGVLDPHPEDYFPRRRGAGVLLTEPVAVSAEGMTTPGSLGLWSDRQAEAWRFAIEPAERAGSRVCLVLGHAGRRGATRQRDHGIDRPLREGAWPLLSASAIPYSPRSQVPKEMDGQDTDRVRDDFVTAARNAAGTGAWMLMLDFSHGYLLASFLSPLSNRRADDFGGSLENRLRFPLEVLDAVRAEWAGPLAVRFSAADWARGGLEPEDALKIAAAFRDHGCDLIHPVAGQTVPDDRPSHGRFYLVPFSDRIRNEVRIPTMTSGNLTTADEVNTILAAGRADLCLLDPRVYR